MTLRCVKCRLGEPSGRIQRDYIVVVANQSKRSAYPKHRRRVTAIVDNNGVDKEMVFFSNNLDWAPSSICDLYKCRLTNRTNRTNRASVQASASRDAFVHLVQAARRNVLLGPLVAALSRTPIVDRVADGWSLAPATKAQTSTPRRMFV